ncbi:hypothetical protein [Streptomyces termitum]|uniref:hypothetical protein n=1 Tax=Streptomyces termitum TaxID=67368 RepID=UPI0033A30B68
MGSLRNPVGPLPSTIYWRRRAVALCLMALLALLTVWFLVSGGEDGKRPGDAANGSSSAPPSITPGPSGTGPAISQQPGGRDESDDSGESGDNGTGGDGGSGTGAGDGSSGADGSGPDTGGSGTAGKNGDTDGAGADGGAGTGAGQRVPAGSPLPNCPAGSLLLTLRTPQVGYAPGEKPRFDLLVRNTSATDCKADLGPRAAVLTVRDSRNERLWSTDDCPGPGAPVLLRIPARTTVTHTVEWDLRRSVPGCATTPADRPGPGTYVVEATVSGAKVLPASFTLTKD